MQSFMNLRTILILFVILLCTAWGQQRNIYQQQFSAIVKNSTSEDDYNKNVRDLFQKLSNKDFAQALSVISSTYDENMIANDIFHLIKNRFTEKEIRKEVLSELVKDSNSEPFRIVTIDFISKYIGDDIEELKTFNDILFEIAQNSSLSDKLRSYSASHLGVVKDYNSNKTILLSLLNGENISVINGASSALKKFIHSDTPEIEMEFWTNVLITTLNKNISNLENLKATLKVLSLTGSDDAKKYLLKIFSDYSPYDYQLSETLAYNLIYLADENVMINIFDAYFTHEHFFNFGSELMLMQLVDNKTDILERLYSDSDSKSAITFLRAVRFSAQKSIFSEKALKLLKHSSEKVRYESVKSLHFILPYSEENTVFKNHLKSEESDLVKNEIYNYIGRIF